MNRKTQQILTAAVVLVSVTVLSFGIRQVRIGVHRARVAASAQEPVSNDAGPEQYSAKEPAGFARNTQMHDVPLEQDEQAADAMTDSQEAFAEADDQDGWEQPDDQHNGQKHSLVSMGKSFKGDYVKSKGDYAKSKGSKGFQKISVSEYENIYITDKGERWYVAENPDGTVTKMQMQEVDGELQPVGETNVYRSEGGKGKSEGDQGK
ncbi:MAG: hypothetical protein ISS79_03425 [Phycisphaerae bacterium]|nr:hypothetical protein [Phycisphaerae bacterium]